MTACLLFSSPSLLQRKDSRAASARNSTSPPNAIHKLGHTRALEAACRIAQPAVALLTMRPQLWVPLLLLCASLVATPIGAEAAAAASAMMPNYNGTGDRFGNIPHIHWRTMRTSVQSFGAALVAAHPPVRQIQTTFLQAL